MKTVSIISTIVSNVYIGRCWQENEELINTSAPEDIWFHLDGESSCHLVLKNHMNIPVNKLDKKLVKRCALLVKQHTNKCIQHKKYTIICCNIDNLSLCGHGSVEFLHEDCVKYIVV
jgi:hypothetical protein